MGIFGGPDHVSSIQHGWTDDSPPPTLSALQKQLEQVQVIVDDLNRQVARHLYAERLSHSDSLRAMVEARNVLRASTTTTPRVQRISSRA